MIEGSTPREMNAGVSVILIMLAILLGFVIIGPIIGFFIALPFYPGNFKDFVAAIFSAKLDEVIRLPMLILQGSATALGLILFPWLYYTYIERKSIVSLLTEVNFLPLWLTFAIVISFMFPNSIFIEWNSNIKFPESFHSWAREREELALAFTKFLTTFNSFGDFLFGFFLIAVLPAIGEEFSFRGLLQPAIQRATGNVHVAIWVTAIFFSAFHLQFFGFVPRLFLGALFGYMMYWSNNLWIPMMAHFVNNGVSVVLMYLYQLKKIEFDAEATEAIPLIWVAPFTMLFIYSLYSLKKYFSRNGEKNI